MSPGSSHEKTGAPGSNWNSASEEKMRRLDRLASLGLISASMAHEIKNSMVAIKTFVELLLQKGEDKELNDVVARELKRIDSMVSQMLRFGAASKNEFKPIRAHDILDVSLRLIEHQLSGKLISVTRNYKAAKDVVRGDEFQLQQAFMNLLFNAIEAMGANGVLTVATENLSEDGREILMIKIQDTGVGISPENLGKLFEPFFTTKKNGTGLGLAISKKIIHEHLGGIRPESKLNKGSTFSVSLPLQ